MKRALLPSVLLLLGLLAGCTTYDARHNRSLSGVHSYFVLSNGNDNHALDRQIATALRARGFEAFTGPLTMMPDETQAIVYYQDHWSWDFGDHLDYLQITANERKSGQPYGTATFNASGPTRQPPGSIVDELVVKLLQGTR